MKRENLVAPPPWMKKGALQRDGSKYCNYHKDHSHNTDEWIHLKEKIDELIHQGHLKNFVLGQKQKGKMFEK